MRDAEVDSSRVVEQMSSALSQASRTFAEGGSAEESLSEANRALEYVVDVPPALFLTMSPHTMLGLLEMSGADDTVLAKVAETLLFHAELLQAEGEMIEAEARRDQADAILEFIDPLRAN